MTKREPLFELTVDIVEAIPSLDDLRKYGIATMRVRTSGPGGGNPCVTLGFTTMPTQANAITNARAFLSEWMGSTEVDEDLELATGVSPAL